MGDKWILFTGPTCPWCDKAKDLLADYEVDYEEVCVDSREKFCVMQDYAFGHKSVPVLYHNGNVAAGWPMISKYLTDHFAFPDTSV